MTIIQIERELKSLGYKLTRYLTPEEGMGFAVTKPGELRDKDIVIVKAGKEDYKIFLSTPVKTTGVNPISPVDVVYRDSVVYSVAQLTERAYWGL
jgi:hypothetical protein